MQSPPMQRFAEEEVSLNYWRTGPFKIFTVGPPRPPKRALNDGRTFTSEPLFCFWNSRTINRSGADAHGHALGGPLRALCQSARQRSELSQYLSTVLKAGNSQQLLPNPLQSERPSIQCHLENCTRATPLLCD